MENRVQEILNILMESEPEAMAQIQGDVQYSELQGTVLFYPFWSGTLVFIYCTVLPDSTDVCQKKICAFHIHEDSQCSGPANNPFANAGTHYNPTNCPHPSHAGDMPVLFSNHGTALQIFYTDRFMPQNVIGRTAIIHAEPDDYRTQPSGNSGMMIACGEIKSIERRRPSFL